MERKTKIQGYLKKRDYAPSRKNMLRGIKYILAIFAAICILPMILILFLLHNIEDLPPYLYTKEYNTIQSKVTRERVEHVLRLVQLNIDDYNGDHKINCQDHTALFKYYWDKEYPASAHWARPTYNYNPYGPMNHLFITLFDGDRKYYIETQGTLDNYSMYMIWGKKYNPAYNVDYGLRCFTLLGFDFWS